MYFFARQKELEFLSHDTAHKLMLLDAARKRLRKEENMNYNVTLKTIPARYAATVRMTIPRYEVGGLQNQNRIAPNARRHWAQPCFSFFGIILRGMLF